MSQDTDAAMVCFAARQLLDADRPLTMDEIFPHHIEKCYGIKLSRHVMRKVIGIMLTRDELIEVKTGTSIKYRVNPDNLHGFKTFAMPPEALSKQEEETMRRGIGYHKDTEEHKAKVYIALRSLKRLAISSAGMPRNAIFIAQKGNKFQERAIWNNGWQIPFLDELLSRNVITADEADGVTIIQPIDTDFLIKVSEWKSDVCIYTLLWPDTPCTVDHSKVENVMTHTRDPEEDSDQSSDSDQPDEHESDPDVVTSASLEQSTAKTSKEAYSKDHLLLILDAQAAMIKFLNTICGEMKQLVEKTDELVKSNEASNQARIHLSKELSKLAKEVSHLDSSLSTNVGKLQTKVDNMEQSVTNIKKTIENHISTVREAVANIAAAMAESSSKVTGEMNRLREDFKSQVKIPAIMSRIGSFQEELTKLKAILLSKHS